MAGIRPGHCYTPLERAYTRKSKYKKKAFIKTIPPIKIAKFDAGDLKKDFPCQVDLVTKETMQIRHNALESARTIIVRDIEAKNRPYRIKIRVYPHHALRENKMITGAGADRMQTGMQLAFGRVIGSAAQVKAGKPLFSIYISPEDIPLVSSALKRSAARLPCRCQVVIVKPGK